MSALKKPTHFVAPPRDKKGVRARPTRGFHDVQVQNAFAITLIENEKAFAELAKV
ncbi:MULTISPECIES: hypothetical protein [Pseudomonas]|mgnify:CR=1 FL=1|uniref:hypothetical protein n=1 Tax=Pseudomonas TaxID=286 RepID=UPI000B0269CA|nr:MULTISPECIES: hypothetical protein [Pseudomonas]MBC3419287.1 hypothetical protein [Pseudomonas sp. RW3S2]MCE1021151.1 hypothetical protein [Pseudomonas monteilii]HCF2575854.1 hypothetical protein [Pseudomonas aeruginosa]